MEIYGKFIGKTSRGFVTGRMYLIRLSWDGLYIWIHRVDGPGCCPYTSVKAVAANWEIPAK